MSSLFITTKEAAQMLGISVRSVQDLCAARSFDFPAVKCGKKYLINVRLLEDWTERVAREGGSIFFKG